MASSLSRLTRGIDGVLGSEAIGAVGRLTTAGSLRVLAYHQVDDAASFRWQMRYLRERFVPVSSALVLQALQGEANLPARAAWVTFDDADPSVVEQGLPILSDMDVPSSMFVCPGLVDSHQPFWWETVEHALQAGVAASVQGRSFGRQNLLGLLGVLKGLGDAQRREVVGDLERRALDLRGRPYRRRQITTEQLDRYLASGATLGNHTWDHPCLDRCDPHAQRQQIEQAHAWLEGYLGEPPLIFAYPNGNHSLQSESILNELGYQVGLLFDHRLGSLSQNPLRISRLRVNASTAPRRFAAILSGAHPAVHQLRRRLARA
ncbi:MAG: polysaccharide deacetylase family protein [Actinomycetota bacterium]|nr:polysaccharide deacetylase family protein [Actinomycetota bacterium]